MIDGLATEIAKRQQVDCPVVHHFGPSLYIREVRLPAGTCAIGHIQTTTHMNVFVQGKVLVVNDDGTKTLLEAPMTFVSPPGRKVGYVIEDVVWLNVYATDETDVDKLEAMFLDKTGTPEPEELKLLTCDHSEDNADFDRMCEDLGTTPEQVWKESDNQADQMPMPWGGWPVKIGDSLIHGKGVFATSKIGSGDVIGPARLSGYRTPIGRFGNHAKNPNARVEILPNGDAWLVALRDIGGMRGGMMGEEITTDYRQTVAEIKESLCRV